MLDNRQDHPETSSVRNVASDNESGNQSVVNLADSESVFTTEDSSSSSDGDTSSVPSSAESAADGSGSPPDESPLIRSLPDQDLGQLQAKEE